jgi:hypothetical protein
MDYSISEFRGTDIGMEIDSVGEVSLRGRGGTPFGPIELQLPEAANEEVMLQMLVSDFLPNSLMYHGHTYEELLFFLILTKHFRIGLFNAKVSHLLYHRLYPL